MKNLRYTKKEEKVNEEKRSVGILGFGLGFRRRFDIRHIGSRFQSQHPPPSRGHTRNSLYRQIRNPSLAPLRLITSSKLSCWPWRTTFLGSPPPPPPENTSACSDPGRALDGAATHVSGVLHGL
ncbi:hypothetical protein MY4038_005138 [Beauveria bassiana]